MLKQAPDELEAESHILASDKGLLAYELDDRYLKTSGRVFLSGTQALVAIMIRQKRLDEAQGINTAGFISGYRGSPLGAVDQTAWQAKAILDEHKIRFLPAINEDLAATAVLGTQQLEIEKDSSVDGVFSMWYGKGPGVDRSCDALKHGNAFGSSPHGGVLVVAGDDHGCVSSSMSHQSDVALMSAYIPTLHPSNIEEYLEYGAYGIAMSRYSGMWIGFKAISEVVEGGASCEIPKEPDFAVPNDYTIPQDSLNYRWPDLPGMQLEKRMIEKKNAVLAFARANPIDKAIYDIDGAHYGIITTGKAHKDLMEALSLLDIDESRAREIGLDIYKVGMVWPLECRGVEQFLKGKEEVLVVEEKRGLIESQLKEHLYDRDIEKPRLILGKHDENGKQLISWVEELSPSGLAPILAKRLSGLFPSVLFEKHLFGLQCAKLGNASPGTLTTEAKRIPFFCSGCPHNTSTKVPEGSKALAGIGCHFMASWMGRDTSDLIQMGGEGVNWAAKSLFLKGNKHIFQNLGDGTYFHSGYLAIRQAIAAKANITYKILYNDAVAMTGGQPVDGMITLGQMATQVTAEGAKKVVIVSDQPELIEKLGGYPANTELYHRDDLDKVQRELREIDGVTVLIYEQTCASEKRKRRKRGLYPDPPKRIFINDLVCEACGDCSKQSNCLSIHPKDTPLGRKRMIDQSSCNKDYSCIKGFCPSFVTVEGGQLRKPETKEVSAELTDLMDTLPTPSIPKIERVYDLLVGGVGGTGVVTIGAIVTMAAHLESKGASVLDFMGFAQKGGTVLSYVRLSDNPKQLNQVRIDKGAADAAIICDLVVGTDPRSLSVMREGKTRVAANTHILPTADFIQNRGVDFQSKLRINTLKDNCGADQIDNFNASAIAEAFLGDTVFSNILLLGFAWQKGLVPLSLKALDRAITLNGVAVEKNIRAFSIGRAAAVDFELVYRSAELLEPVPEEQTLAELVAPRSEFLVAYQNKAYARKYKDFVEDLRTKSRAIDTSEELAKAAAKNLFKLMAYKDEYEVARLHNDKSFKQKLARQFEGNYTLKYHLAPPMLHRGLDADVRPKKRTFGAWMGTTFAILKHFKVLRGTPLDLMGMTAERKMERRLICEYRQDLMTILSKLTTDNLSIAIEIANIPDEIRGYGPVKLESVEKTTNKKKQLLSSFYQSVQSTN